MNKNSKNSQGYITYRKKNIDNTKEEITRK